MHISVQSELLGKSHTFTMKLSETLHSVISKSLNWQRGNAETQNKETLQNKQHRLNLTGQK